MTRLYRALLTAWIGATVASSAHAADPPPQRFSIAISGGASVGAYEAGLNWGLLTIMRDIASAPSVLGGQFRPFEAASVAGASAGSINALLSATLWCAKPENDGGLTNRVSENIFRDLWLLPDVNTLLPPNADSPVYRHDDALLARHSLLKASGELREKWRRSAFRPGCRMPLGVTVTRVFPEVVTVGDIKVQNQRFAIPFEFRVTAQGTGGFFFDPGDYPGLRDYSMILLPGERATAASSIDQDRVEEAALTSSAFPAAFGRKRLKYCRIAAAYGDEPATPPSAEESAPFSELTCPPGYELSEAEFADGGLFDNLPIGLARTLAERNRRDHSNPLPVTYFYIDPNRLRFATPDRGTYSACRGANAPAACQEMEYGFSSESHLLVDALGTARKYELYRELTSEDWSLNLAEMAFDLADILEEARDIPLACEDALPFFDRTLSCPEALRRAGRLLRVAYSRIEAPIVAPFSLAQLEQLGLVTDCRPSDRALDSAIRGYCQIDPQRYRNELGERLVALAHDNAALDATTQQRIRRAQLAMHNDRLVRVSSRGAPITGTLLGHFGAFLDLKFREYDYYVGVYDAVDMASTSVCQQHFALRREPAQFVACHGAVAEHIYASFDLQADPRGAYVFALLARGEYGGRGDMAFAYEPMPAEDRDMAIIHEALQVTLEAQWRRVGGGSVRALETEFFDHLHASGFEPRLTSDGNAPLLLSIMKDPEQWSHELVNRSTERLMHLEQQSEKVIAAREPDPSKRPASVSSLIGGTAFALRTAAYKDQPFDFAPSTAPRTWVWRNVIPYEVGLDLADGDVQLNWQPTWNLGERTNLALRATLGFADGLFGDQEDRKNYGALGVNFVRFISLPTISSWGITPAAYYGSFSEPASGKQHTWGADAHLGFLKNRLRVAVGARDVHEFSDTWFLLFGIADVPGMVYWFTR